MNKQILLVYSEIGIFKKFHNVEDLNPFFGYCEGYLRGCESLPLIMAAQILVVFEI